jgi:hypothetical protein
LYDDAAALDAPGEIGGTDDAGAGDAGFGTLPLSADSENWPCAASSASMVAGDSASELELLDCVEFDESEPDIVNGSAPLEKNPPFFVEDEGEEDDETCEARDLTASHAADAAPKAISMIKTSQCRTRRLLLYYQLSASAVPDKKCNKSSLSCAERTSQGRQLLPRRQDLPL